MTCIGCFCFVSEVMRTAPDFGEHMVTASLYLENQFIGGLEAAIEHNEDKEVYVFNVTLWFQKLGIFLLIHVIFCASTPIRSNLLIYASEN